jgi:hypothetical protein
MNIKKNTAIAVAAMAFAGVAWSQPMKPSYEEPSEYRERSDEFRDAYRRGYERGFERGYSKGLADGERRGAPVVAPPPPPALHIGPIRISGAYYGTSSKNCDATRWLGHRANGKRSYSIEVTNDICGDPARGARKSLEVTYRCGDIEKTASANEHRTVYLDCSS